MEERQEENGSDEELTIVSSPNLFVLQSDELLREVRLVKDESVETVLQNLRSLFISDSLKSISIDSEKGDSILKAHNLLPPHCCTKKKKFRIEKSFSVHVVGCFLLGCVTQPRQIIEVAVEMPSSMLLAKDFKQGTYLWKRSVFMCVIADFLSKHKFTVKVMEKDGKPVVVISIPSSECVIQVVTVTDYNSFPCDKLYPSRSNLLSSKGQPTPVYNGEVVEDMRKVSLLRHVHKIFSNCPALSDTVSLLRVWSAQRGLFCGENGMDENTLAVIAAYAVSLDTSHNFLKAEVLLRVVCDTMYKLDEELRILVDNEDEDDVMGDVMMDGRAEQFSAAYPVVLLDCSGTWNVLYGVSSSTWSDVKMECKAALRMLKDTAVDTFDSLFLTSLHSSLKYDTLLDMKVESMREDEYERMDNIEKVLRILKKAMGERVVHVGVVRQEDKNLLRVGLMLNSSQEVVSRTIELGPLANNENECVEFREFWGDIVQMRKFKDGSIRLCVIFSPPHGDRRLILQSISQHVLNVHCSDLVSSVKQRKEWTVGWNITKGHVEYCQSVRRSYDKLSSILLSLTSTPLRIVHVTSNDPALRYTQWNPPTTDSCCLRFMNVIIVLETSSRWPQDVEGIRKLKSVFLLDMAKEIRDIHGLEAVVLDEGLNVVCAAYNYRCLIYLEYEPKMLVEKEGRVLEAKTLLTHLYDKSQHHTYIHSFGLNHPYYFESTRMAEYFVSLVHLSRHIPHEVVELLMVNVFSKSSCNMQAEFSPPGSAIVGLKRFMQLVSRKDLEEKPLVVDNEGEKKLSEIEKDKKVCLQLVYHLDPEGTRWTGAGGLTEMSLSRLRAACSSMLRRLLGYVLVKSGELISLNVYDVVLHLKEIGDRDVEEWRRRFVDGGDVLCPRAAMIGLDPVEDFLALLRIRFEGGICYFFEIPYVERRAQRISSIGIAFCPAAFTPQQLTQENGSTAWPMSGSNKVLPNIFEVLSDIKSMGEGIIEKVTINRGRNCR